MLLTKLAVKCLSKIRESWWINRISRTLCVLYSRRGKLPCAILSVPSIISSQCIRCQRKFRFQCTLPRDRFPCGMTCFCLRNSWLVTFFSFEWLDHKSLDDKNAPKIEFWGCIIALHSRPLRWSWDLESKKKQSLVTYVYQAEWQEEQGSSASSGWWGSTKLVVSFAITSQS